MLEHLDAIIQALDDLPNHEKIEYEEKDLDKMKKLSRGLKYDLDLLRKSDEKSLLNLKELSSLIFNLNWVNKQERITDYISNEMYAFEFLLEEEIKKRRK